METVCAKHFKGSEITEDDELILIDYLYDNGIEVDMDVEHDELCRLAMIKRLGSEKNLEDWIANLDKPIEMRSEKYNPNKYGDLNLNTYLKIALMSDDRTVLNMMYALPLNWKHFDDKFFKNYFELHYPNLLIYRPAEKSLREYYLKVVYSIAKLQENYDFKYNPEMEYNVVETLKEAERINKFSPQYVKSFLERKNNLF